MDRATLTRTWMNPPPPSRTGHSGMTANPIVRHVVSALPLFAIPFIVWRLVPVHPAWIWMWLMALAIFAGCKWLTWCNAAGIGASVARQLGYFLTWPGMDAERFLPNRPDIKKPAHREWAMAWLKTALGAAIVFCAAQYAKLGTPACWFGIAGIVLFLHFGVFHLLSCTWRRAGVDAPPIMDRPLAATSVNDFWARRWNTAYRDLVHRYVFVPLSRLLGPILALVVAFATSGLVHELVITVPARGGYGGPTAFFLLQAAAILLERSSVGHRLALGRGMSRRVFTAAALLLPLPLLCPPSFLQGIIQPFLALGHVDFIHQAHRLRQYLPALLIVAGICQLGLLIPASLLPGHLNWKKEFSSLPRLLRQMSWIYPGYVVLSFLAFAIISLTHSAELASGSGLARAICTYICVFWSVRLALQPAFDVKAFITTWWLKWGYRALAVDFTYLVLVYAAAAIL
jgi:hypothetical protein